MAELKDLIVTGPTNLIGESFTDIIHANKFMTNRGGQNDFVKGDGSLDNSVYITASALTGLALDSDVVHKANPETITGIKTFNAGLNIKEGEAIFFKRIINDEDKGPYLNGGYDSTNSEPTLTFYGSYGSEAVRLTNVENPRNSNDAVNLQYLTAQGYTTNTGTVTGVTLNTEGTNYSPDASGIVTLPVASSSVLGVVKIGSGLSIDSAGLLIATGGGSTSIMYDGNTIQFDPDTAVVPDTETSTKTVNVVSSNAVQNVTGTLEGKITSIKSAAASKSWNQLITNGDFSRWKTIETSSTPDDFARHSYAGTGYMNASRINAGDTDGIKMSWKSSTGSSTGYIYCYMPYVAVGHKYYVTCWRRTNKTTRCLILNTTSSRGAIDFSADTTGSFVSGIITTNSSTTTTNTRFGIGILQGRSGDYLEIRYLNVVDLTRIYGEGLEPTAPQFETDYGTEWRTKCEFCEPEITGYKEPGITFTGYNLLVNGNKTILPPGTYKIEGDYTSISFSPLTLGETGYTTLSPSSGVFTLTDPGYVLVEGYNTSTTCIHKSASSVSYAAPTKSTVMINPTEICGTCDGETEIVFPNGLMKIGSTCDEITTDPDGIARTATKRINVRASREEDTNSETMITDGVNTAEIITSKTYQLVGPIDMRFMTESSGIDVFSTALDGEKMGFIRNISISLSYTEYEDITPVRNTQYDTDKRPIHDHRVDGVDITPTDNSSNVVTSGGVKNYVDRRCRVFYGECYTDGTFPVKNVLCPEMKQEDLVPGTILILKMWYMNTATPVASLRIDVNNFGEYPIKKIYTTSGEVNLTHQYELAGTALLYFSGDNWILATTDYNSTYANYNFGNGYAIDNREDNTSPTTVTALYGSSGSTKYYKLTNNGIVAVRFIYDVGANATLCIDDTNSGTGIPILYQGAPITAGIINAGDTATFVYSTSTGVTGYTTGYVLLSIDHGAFDGSKLGLVPVPDSQYSENLRSIYMTGNGTWSEFATDAVSAVGNQFLPRTGGDMTGSTPYITNMSTTLPNGVDITNPSETHRGYATSLGMVKDNFLCLMGGTMDMRGTGINMNGAVLAGVPSPRYGYPNDAANKQYVDDRCNNREWSHVDYRPNQLDGTKEVQAIFVDTRNTTAQNTLTFSTPMQDDTTCHIFAYGGNVDTMSSPAGSGSTSHNGTLIIPFNMTAAGTTAGSLDTIIVNNEVVYHEGTARTNDSSLEIAIGDNKIVEISVMYQSYQRINNTTVHRTIIKTAS